MSDCKITYASNACPQPGEYVMPQGPKARTAYLVIASREVKARIPRDYLIWMLTVIRMERSEVPPAAVCHPLYWFKRERKRRTLRDIYG